MGFFVSFLLLFGLIIVKYTLSSPPSNSANSFGNHASNADHASTLNIESGSCGEAARPNIISKAYSYEDHKSQIQKLLNQVDKRSHRQKITLRRNPSQSHCPRPHEYKSKSLQLDVSEMIHPLSVYRLGKDRKPIFNDCSIADDDVKLASRKVAIPKQFLSDESVAAVVEVQAMISYSDLVDYLLPHGLIPAVVPEFKGITVGGSLQGLAAESTSFKYGFVHDTVLGFEALLGDGRLIWCSPSSNKDLFYALPGSFGSLAVVTRVQLLCIKAQPFIEVSCRSHSSPEHCVEFMARLQDKLLLLSTRQGVSKSADGEDKMDTLAVEGIGFSQDKVLSVCGRFLSIEEALKGGRFVADRPVRLSRCNIWGNKWFFNQVRDLCRRKNRSGSLMAEDGEKGEGVDVGAIVFPTKDYLFRHDQGSFWMASYRIPQFIGRWMGSILDSTNMFKLANALPWAFPKSMIVLQDFMLPRINVTQFFSEMEKQLEVWPVWLLPMRNIKTAGSLFAAPIMDGHLCNVGAYGIPSKHYSFVSANKALETLLYRFGGRKVYYSHAFYDRYFFYDQLYDGGSYFKLRRKFGAEDALPEIYDKVITKNGRL